MCCRLYLLLAVGGVSFRSFLVNLPPRWFQLIILFLFLCVSEQVLCFRFWREQDGFLLVRTTLKSAFAGASTNSYPENRVESMHWVLHCSRLLLGTHLGLRGLVFTMMAENEVWTEELVRHWLFQTEEKTIKLTRLWLLYLETLEGLSTWERNFLMFRRCLRQRTNTG